MATLQAGVGISTASSAAEAVQEAVRQASQTMDGAAPGLAFVTTTVDHDAHAVHAALRALLPETKIHGVTTSLGVLGSAGVTMGPRGVVGVLLLGGAGVRFAVGSALVGDDPEAAGRAAAEALGAERPAMIFFGASPGQEEDLLRGVAQVIPGVPIYGGSAADHAIAGEWKVITEDGAQSDAVSLAAVFGEVRIGSAFVAPYRATGASAEVSLASGRTLLALDGRPAAETLREWVGPAIDPQLRDGGNVLAQTALRPVAIRYASDAGDYYLTIHPANVRAEEGAVDIFARVRAGQRLCAMEATAEELIGSIDRLVAEAQQSAGLRPVDVRAAVLIYCAGCAGAVGGELHAGLRQVWQRTMPGVPLLGLCTFGEQGTVPGVGPVHANLSLGLVLLGA